MWIDHPLEPLEVRQSLFSRISLCLSKKSLWMARLNLLNPSFTVLPLSIGANCSACKTGLIDVFTGAGLT